MLNEPSLVERLRTNSEHLTRALHQLGLGAAREIHTPISGFVLQNDRQMDLLEARLRARGIAVPLIRYPGGAWERYFRVSVTARHTPAQIDLLMRTIREVLD